MGFDTSLNSPNFYFLGLIGLGYRMILEDPKKVILGAKGFDNPRVPSLSREEKRPVQSPRAERNGERTSPL